MAVSANISNQEIRDRVAPIRNDTDNWGDNELTRRWERGVEYVQGRLAGYLTKTQLDTFNTDAGITTLFKMLYGAAAAMFVWKDIRGDEEVEYINYRSLRKEVDDLIDEIITGKRKVYDASGTEITVSNVGEDDFHYTRDGVEPEFRRGRYDSDGNLLDDEEGSLDGW